MAVQIGYDTTLVDVIDTGVQAWSPLQAYYSPEAGIEYDLGYRAGFAAALVTTPVVAPTPIPAPFTSTSPQYTDHVLAAFDRLCEQFKAKTS